MIPTGSLKVSDPRDAAGQPLAVNGLRLLD